MIKISCIVPVYNVEDYIEECLESLLNQKLKDIEIIIVNDGSTDSSMDKVKKFNDSRIKIINQSNQGLSAARNTGIRHSTGKYLLFMDSDDFIANDYCLEEMYELAEEYNSDILVGNAKCYYEDGSTACFYKDPKYFYKRSMSGAEYLINTVDSDDMHVTVWIHLYNREFILKNNLYFQVGILHEDELFTPKAFLKAKNVSLYPDAFYMYRQRAGSIMSSKRDAKRGNDLVYICNELRHEYKKLDKGELRSKLEKVMYILLYDTVTRYKGIKIPLDLRIALIKNCSGIQRKLSIVLLSINYNLYKKIYNYRMKEI